ncbi:metal-sensitive transcriptional regulator [Aquibacillus salsiterrae]|uniref:Metal-sensitive transcriptional regulator n=1 Tax=Aquibacillus salsiterrae TaxID=2950439 RepID=A0A9X3WGS0_9BACI|nr:metal-sensitive transcriptional regulator [Aquibacillus salsiterrae]MDC3418131.1 metal-sensitive transcriptional regulator [Aquibacillus salsiterrae]
MKEDMETYKYHDHKDKLLKRLRRMEGQVRGVHRMIEEDRYCVDVLYQLAAIKAATNKIGLELIEDHTRGCVARAVKEKDDDGESQIQELMEVFRTFAK